MENASSRLKYEKLDFSLGLLFTESTHSVLYWNIESQVFSSFFFKLKKNLFFRWLDYSKKDLLPFIPLAGDGSGPKVKIVTTPTYGEQTTNGFV